ncbi:MAG: glycosyltransferase family 4 protein, partial [bacterium]|nr:glycosyltransferase family 4 protein [bacterium]
ISSQNPMTVAQLVETMEMGGAENLAVRIANELAVQGHDSHLIVTGEPGVLSDRISDDVSVHYLRLVRESVNNPFAFLRSLKRGVGLLEGLILDNNLQVIQTHLPGANFWGLLLSLRKTCPVLATIHNNEEFKYGDADNPVRSFMRKKAYQQIVKRSAGTVAVSTEVKNSLIRDLGACDRDSEKIFVVTNGVEIPEPVTEEEVVSLRAGLPVNSELKLILAAGRFSEQKNFADLIRAASVLKEKTQDFQLVIGGDGPQRDELESLIGELDLGEFVFLPGNLVNLNSVMQAADVFVMSSLWEGLPLVLLEAMAAGLPSVGYDIKGIDEIIEDGVHGYIAPTGDVDGLADRLFWVLGDDVRRGEMGDAGRALVAEEYNFLGLVEALVGVYGVAVG